MSELDPSEFVQRIRQLGEQHDQEDAERVKKLEEQLLAGRSERLARRAERARSISPDKPYTPQSPRSAAAAAAAAAAAITPRSMQEKAASTPTPIMSPPLPSQDQYDVAREDSLQRLTSSPAPITLEDTEPKKPALSAAALGRSGTLSWKQRPQSGSMRRPLSMSPTRKERPDFSSPPEPSSPEANPSRSSIAASLAAKDPTWFRQTADRGAGSAAYRKSQEETTSDAGSVSGRRQLPGMSRESTIEPELGSPPPESARSSSPGSRGGSVRGSAMLSNRFSSNTSISGGDAEALAKTRSPLPILESQKFAPPSEPASSVGDAEETRSTARGMAMSPTQERILPERERSTSPTKGMGGFVQSAMLKRSDSVSKRWSTQAPPGLSRQNSTLSNRGSAMAGYGSLSRNDRPGLSRDNSIEPSSRPSSSHSNATITRDTESDRRSRDEFVKPALPLHSRSKSVHSTFSEKAQPQDETSPPSPSKRWSPTKSSWLESALNKPESPKLKQPPPAQPAWMAEINRLKQAKSSVDLGKNESTQISSTEPFGPGRISPSKDILRPASLRRPSSPKKEDSFGSEKVENSAALPLKSQPVILPKPTSNNETDIATAKEAAKQDGLESSKEIHDTSLVEKSSVAAAEPEASTMSVKEIPPTTAPKPVTSRFPPVKPKPDTAQKFDFRAGLKPRSTTGDSSKSEAVNELQNVFGKLRKAETKNYVAPDLLKDNITRGKNALNVTGGPKPTVRRDEFRESLKSKKSMMLEKAEKEGSVLKKSDSSSEPAPTPEAIARRSVLNRADSGSKPSEAPKMQAPTPEALARKKSLRSIKPEADSKPIQPAPSLATKEPALSGKLAGRFNPALAGMLARGPPALATNKSASSAEADVSSTRNTQDEKTGPAPELQHMTKGRARGPKRRAPAKQASESGDKQEKVTTTAAAVPLVKPEHVLPSSTSTKTNGNSEESLAATRTPVRQSVAEKPATPAKSARIASSNFGSLTEKPTSSKPATPAKSPRVASGNFGKTSTPEVPKKPTSIELERRVSGVQEATKQSPRPESTESVKPASPGVPKKPIVLDTDKRISTSQNTPQKSPLPKFVETPKPAASSSPSPIVNQSRFSRPLPTLPPKPGSPKPLASKETASPNIEATPAKEEPAPAKSTFASVRSATTLWGRQSASSSPSPARTPIKLPTKADEDAAMRNAGLDRSPRPESKELPQLPQAQAESPTVSKPQPPKPKPAGLGFSLGSLGGLVTSRSRESAPVAQKVAPMSPPMSADRPQSESFTASPKPAKSDGMFADFFDEAPITEASLAENIDTERILKSPPLDLGPAGKIRTLRKNIQEVDGYGKLTPVLGHEEHVLFRDSMYLCSHVYGDAKGAKSTDVYHWVGNGVSESTLEDAQLFAKNYARQNQGKLVTVRQGQESPNFFDALGGIVITRRGSNPASKEFMLCGRRHLGHLAFDEVDFSLKSLCSAFPYLISVPSGSLGMTKIYLWKGRGCSAEELSGARLMGMDLAPSGDFNEIDEGAEPQAFVDVFPAPAVPSKGPLIPRSADHWRYKASSDKYRVRLFKVEQLTATVGWGQALQVSSSFFAPLLRRPSWNTIAEQRPQTPLTPRSPAVKTEIKEIMPFSQRDLEPENVYVLDAFFEMYIVVGALSQTQAHAFSTALLFAQEYGMLAVSEEDRPFMPVTTVVLEGVPRDMKAVFRHWDDAIIPAAGLMNGKLGRGKSLRIVGLEKAIEATRR